MAVPLTTKMQGEIANLYISILGRNPDPVGFGYWCDVYANANGTKAALDAIASGFGKSPEFVGIYSGQTVAQAVALMYNNIIGRPQDQAGADYWVTQTTNAINSGRTVGDAYAITAQAMITAAQGSGTADATNTLAKQAAAIAAGTATPASTYTLTTSIDTATATFFDGSLNSAGNQTLNNGDQLTGRGATGNRLDATITASVTPALLSNIQTVEITNSTSGAGAAALTVGLVSATGTTNLVNDGSTSALTFANAGASATTVTVQNTSAATTVAYTTTTGTQTIGLNLSNVTTAATVTMAGIEIVNVASNGAANSVDLELAAATNLNFSGAQNLTVAALAAGGNTINVSNINASAMTGNFTVDVGAQTGVSSSTTISITGGSGNDSITFTGVTQAVSAVGGAGNDTFIATDIATTDTINGGDGVDAVRTNSATVAGLTAATAFTNITNVERLEIADAGGGAAVYTLSRVGSGINTIQFNAADTATSTVTSALGTDLIVNIGSGSTDTTTDLATAATLTVTDAGTGITDVANIVVNVSARNAFDSTAIVSTGYETVNINSSGFGAATTQVIGAIGVTGDTGGTTAETVNFTGSNAVSTGAITADFVNASGLTPTTGTVFIASLAAGTVASVTGSSGNDSITSGSGNDTLIGGAGNDTLTAATGNDDIRGGLGNDRIIFGTAGDLTTADLIDGGEGTNTLVVTAADLTTNAALPTASNLAGLSRVSNISTVEAVAVGADAVNVNRVSTGITTVNTVAATTGAATFTFNGGASTLNLGQGLALTAALGAATTLVAAGTGTSDSITVVKATTENENTFAGRLNTITGFETVTFNTGSTAVATAQTTGAIALTGTGTNPALNIAVTGANVFTLGAVTTTGTGLLTINGSGMTAQAAGTTTLTVTAPVTTTGTVSIIGTAGQDVLNGDANDANTILGGAGVDTIVGGTGNDSLDGDTGNDTITTNGGNDTVLGGDGNDLIDASGAAGSVSILGGAGNDTVIMGATISAGDTVDGGAGVNILRQSTALVGNFAGITNFQTLQLDAAMTQDMSRFTGTTFTRVDVASTGSYVVSNAAATMAGVRAVTSTAVTVSMATDTTADSLTFGAATNAAATVNTVTVNDTESLTFNVGAVTTAGLDVTITALNATDLTTMTITGAQDTFVTIGTSGAGTGYGNTVAEATRVITIDGSAATGTVTFSGATATSGQRQVITGSSSAANSLTGGAGADTITGGTVGDSIVGGTGGDTINVQSGTDLIRYTATGQSAVITSIATGQVYTGIDLVSGMGAADLIRVLGTAVTANAYTSVGAAADGVFVTAASTTTLVDNGAVLLRGNYDTLTGVWTASTTGADTLFAYDQDGTDGATSYIGVVLVGVTGLAGTADFNGGDVRITLS